MKETRIHHWILVQRVLLGLACCALVVALIAPKVATERGVYDLLVVLDITQSMNVRDYSIGGKPASRLDFAKEAIRDAMLELPCGSRLGLGIFTEYRTYVLFTPIEVCRNQAELANALDRLNGQMAWAGGSEIAKGLFSGLRAARDLRDRPDLIFITDGHEAPPTNPRYRLHFDGPRGAIGGMVVGAGGLVPRAIPKFSLDGKPQGFWRADEVMQTDLYTRGRGGSVANEPMTETETSGPVVSTGQTPGQEHLSALHEEYLQLLASESGLSYRRLTDASSVFEALSDKVLARSAIAPTDVRWVAGTLALLTLLAVYVALPLIRRQRRVVTSA